MQATNNQTQKLHFHDITSRLKKLQISLPQDGDSFEYVDKDSDKYVRSGLGVRGRREGEDKCKQGFGR